MGHNDEIRATSHFQMAVPDVLQASAVDESQEGKNLSWSTRSLRGSVTLDLNESLPSLEHIHSRNWNGEENYCDACATSATNVTAIYQPPTCADEDSLVVVIHSAPQPSKKEKRALFSGQLHPELSPMMKESFESIGSEKADQILFGQMHPEFSAQNEG